MFRVLVRGDGVPSVPADRPLPPALPQERSRSAGRLPVLGAAHHHRWGHLGHGADQGGDCQCERGRGQRVGKCLLWGDLWGMASLLPALFISGTDTVVQQATNLGVIFSHLLFSNLMSSNPISFNFNIYPKFDHFPFSAPRCSPYLNH